MVARLSREITDICSMTHITKEMTNFMLLNIAECSSEFDVFILNAWNNWLSPSTANAIVRPVLRE